MSLLLETNLGGDLVIDLDLEGSPVLCKNLLKLAKLRYFTSSLVYNVQTNRFFQGGDPTGTGQGGACIHGVLDDDETTSHKRFLKSSSGRRLTPAESRERGRVVAMELNHTKDTIGSQFLITLGQDRPGDGLDGFLVGEEDTAPLSLGVVTEDSNGILDKIEKSYCDTDGRPYADIRIVRMLVLHDPFPDPPGFWEYLQQQEGMVIENQQIMASPDRSKPHQESVPERIPVDELEAEGEETEEQARQRQEKEARQEDHQRAVVLELLGDLPSADYKAPEHVLFVCKLNAVTQDEDLELIFSRFDPNCKADIIRDPETGSSLQYAFVEFSNKQQCVEAYFKMNNALVDDRRIKVDFSQSVSKLWNKHTQQMKGGKQQQQPPRTGQASGEKGSNDSQRQRVGHDSQRQNRGHGNNSPPRRNDWQGDEFGRSERRPGDIRDGRRRDFRDDRPRHGREDGHRLNNDEERFRESHRRMPGDRGDFRMHRGGDDERRHYHRHDIERRKHDRGEEDEEERRRHKLKKRHDDEDIHARGHQRRHREETKNNGGSGQSEERRRRDDDEEHGERRRYVHNRRHNEDDKNHRRRREQRVEEGRRERRDKDDHDRKERSSPREGRRRDDEQRRRRSKERHSHDDDEKNNDEDRRKPKRRGEDYEERTRRRKERNSPDNDEKNDDEDRRKPKRRSEDYEERTRRRKERNSPDDDEDRRKPKRRGEDDEERKHRSKRRHIHSDDEKRKERLESDDNEHTRRGKDDEERKRDKKEKHRHRDEQHEERRRRRE